MFGKPFYRCCQVLHITLNTCGAFTWSETSQFLSSTLLVTRQRVVLLIESLYVYLFFNFLEGISPLRAPISLSWLLMTSDLGLKAKVNPVTFILCRLHVKDSLYSPLSVTPADLLATNIATEPLNLHTASLFSTTYFLVVHAWFHFFFQLLGVALTTILVDAPVTKQTLSLLSF